MCKKLLVGCMFLTFTIIGSLLSLDSLVIFFYGFLFVLFPLSSYKPVVHFVVFVFSGRLDKEIQLTERRLMFTANNLPVSAAEQHLPIMWLLLFAYEDPAVLCHRGRTDVETSNKKLKN